MAKQKERKLKWKHFVFTPEGADRAVHGIKYGDAGFLHLCARLNNGDGLRGYTITDTQFRPGDGGRNTAIDWTGFREMLAKHEAKCPTTLSVFSGHWQATPEGAGLRRRLLHSILREYHHPEALANDLWAWAATGKTDESRNLIGLLVQYWRQFNEPPAPTAPLTGTTPHG
jgi:hypothetical protein